MFDFDAGPVTVTLPDAGKRFMVMQVVNEDQYTPAVFYGAGRHTLTKERIGKRYGIVVVRMLVDPVRHPVGTALVWGGLPEKDALYLPVTPARNDGATIHKLTVKDVPVDGFWSITVYNAEGYLEPNQYNAYSVNNITANRGADGSVAVQFGGCDGEIPNCLPIMKDWNYTVRLFRPRPEVLDGTWRFPETQPVS